MDHLQEIAYGESSGNVPDDVTWPCVTLKVKVVSKIYLDANILKTVRDGGLVPIDHQ